MTLTSDAVIQRLREADTSGALLERVACAVLSDLGFENVVRQLAGSQFGFDISAEFINSEGEREFWKIECKNL